MGELNAEEKRDSNEVFLSLGIFQQRLRK
jgi:hypothetical protein